MDKITIAKLLSVGEGSDVGLSDPRLDGLCALAQKIGSRAPAKTAPVREVMARLGDNWSALILKILATGEYRHATLKRLIGAIATEEDISQRMLTLRLRALEHDGFVVRREEDTVPPRVFYCLTPLGHELEDQMSLVLAWIERNEQAILEARAQFNDANY